MVLTRAPENRGPEEFTLRTASGGEYNPKVKVKLRERAGVDRRELLAEAVEYGLDGGGGGRR